MREFLSVVSFLVNIALSDHPGRAQIRGSKEQTLGVKTWKTQLDGANKHRPEAYATLVSGLSSDLSKPSRELSPRARSDDATRNVRREFMGPGFFSDS
jgi:hypothetical protein